MSLSCYCCVHIVWQIAFLNGSVYIEPWINLVSSSVFFLSSSSSGLLNLWDLICSFLGFLSAKQNQELSVSVFMIAWLATETFKPEQVSVWIMNS